MLVASCTGSGASETTEPIGRRALGPDQFGTIQQAVDAAEPGDLVLISPGVYHEAVNVVTDRITIRGLDRNEVVLDGRFELDNGIRVLGAAGVAIENLTVQNFTSNGVFWTGSTGYRGSYLTAYRNGLYGIYAFDSIDGLLEHSYASGSRDGGFYIGQCYECNAVMDDVVSEYNGLGYSGTNAGGDLYIVNSRFNNNRVGIDVNSGSYELCYPQRQATIVGNLVYDNNQPDTPATGDSLYAMGNGILVLGGIGNVIERNRVVDHDRTGIGLVAFPEFRPNDAMPAERTWDQPCAETRELPLADASTLGSIYWPPIGNRVVGNVVESSGAADLAVAVIDAAGNVVDPTTLDNCFGDNVFGVQRPGRDRGPLPVRRRRRAAATGRPGASTSVTGSRRTPTVGHRSTTRTAPTPAPPLLAGMSNPASAPADPAVDLPPAIDLASIGVPDGP